MTHALQTLLENIVSANGEMRYDAFAAAMRSFNLQEAVKDDDYTVVEADRGSLVVLDKATAITLSLPAVATAGAGFQFFAANINTGGGTVDPDGAETINGASTLAIPQGAFARIWVNAAGDGWRAEIGFDPAKVVFTGGTMDGVAIGGTTPAAGAFTTLKCSEAVVDNNLFTNIYPCSGRFGTPNNAMNLTAAGGDVAKLLNAYNSSVITTPAKFIFDNATYGGAAGALDPVVEQFLLKYAVSADARRWGPEWYIAKIVAGAGTTGTTMTDGVDTLYLRTTNAFTPIPRKYTFGAFLLVETGKAALGTLVVSPGTLDAYRVDGALVDHTNQANVIIGSGAGVKYVEVQRTASDRGYDAVLYFWGTAGCTFYVAMPRLVAGHVVMGSGFGVLANNRVLDL